MNHRRFYPANEKGLPKAPPEHWPKLGYVRRHPRDTNRYAHVVETSDPSTWAPDLSEWPDGRVTRWGVKPPPHKDIFNPGDADISKVLQAFSTEGNLEKMLYIPTTSPDNFRTPTEQFIHVLDRKKRDQVKVDPGIQAAMQDKSFIIRVSLTSGSEVVWRRFRAPAAMALAVLHDQVLGPIMGWARAYHGYVFEDPKDGSVFGPKRYAGYIDMMHADMKYTYIADDRKFPLAGIMHNVGDVCFYTYDLGDAWEHRLEIEEVIDGVPDNHDDRIAILDGECACPPEDGRQMEYIQDYGKFLAQYRENPASKRDLIHQVERTAVNYTSGTAGVPAKFEPLKYDVEYHSALLANALAGPAVQKKTMDDFKETARACNKCQDRLRPLKQCARCGKAFYCSKACQKVDWKDHKKQCKKDVKAAMSSS